MPEPMSEERWEIISRHASQWEEDFYTRPWHWVKNTDGIRLTYMRELLAEVKRLWEEVARRGCVQSEAEDLLDEFEAGRE